MSVKVKGFREIKKYNPTVVKCFLKRFSVERFQTLIYNKHIQILRKKN